MTSTPRWRTLVEDEEDAGNRFRLPPVGGELLPVPVLPALFVLLLLRRSLAGRRMLSFPSRI
ncbi:MAG: hypothetical protein ACRD35_00350 [Candidatus Acidiferrales bacterium]